MRVLPLSLSRLLAVIALASCLGCQHDDKSNQRSASQKSLGLSAPVFVENETCRADPCDDVSTICGTEIASIEIDTILGVVGSGTLVSCLAELGINLPFDGVEIVGMETWDDLRLFLGEKICDAAGCLPPVGPAAAVIGACMCYTRIKGAINCSMAMSACEIAKNETPTEDPTIGACANSSVMACVVDGSGTRRPTTDAEIDIQCRNMARRYRYTEPSDKFNECVANCGALTRSTRAGGCDLNQTADPEQPF